MESKYQLNAKNMTEIWIQFMDYGGCNPKNQNIFKRTINICYAICSVCVIILSTVELTLAKEINLTFFTKIVIIIVGYFQVTIKFMLCQLKAKTLSRMLDMIWHDFWPLNYASDNTRQTLTKIYSLVNVITKVYSVLILGSIFSVLGMTIIAGDRTLPIDIWIPNKETLKMSPYYEIFYIVQVCFMLSHDIVCVIPADSLFMTIIGLVYCQFNIIKDLLENGNTVEDAEECFSVIRRCVEHHNLLLRFLEMMESVYSNSISLIIISGLLLATLNLYAIVMVDDNSLKGMFIFLYICIFSQLYFYCQVGQIIQTEADSIGNAAYNFPWPVVTDSKITSSLRLIVLRSQKQFNLTAGGFMFLNLESFSAIVQTSFSFLTFLENVKSS